MSKSLQREVRQPRRGEKEPGQIHRASLGGGRRRPQLALQYETGGELEHSRGDPLKILGKSVGSGGGRRAERQ